MNRRDFIKYAIATASTITPLVSLAEDNINTSYSRKGLERIPEIEKFDKHLQYILKAENLLEANLQPRKENLAIIHTTEHGGNTLKNCLKRINEELLANYLIGPHGEVYQISPPEYRTNGAGNSVWNGIHNLNYNVVNIEIYANIKRKGVREEQYVGLKGLLEHLHEKYEIKDVLGHNQVACRYYWQLKTYRTVRPEEFVGKPYALRQRKSDPGKNFNWNKVLPNNPYAILDPDILYGRAKVNPPERYKAVEGQLKAEKITTFINELQIQ